MDSLLPPTAAPAPALAPAPAPAPAASAESPAEQRDEEEAAVTASSSSLEDKGASLVDAEQDYGDDDGWTPPTAEEMEEINRRRAHSDACSKKVGELLLKVVHKEGVETSHQEHQC